MKLRFRKLSFLMLVVVCMMLMIMVVSVRVLMVCSGVFWWVEMS